MNSLVIIDFNRTLFDPVQNRLIDGALPLLGDLKQRGVRTVVVSRREPGRADRIRASGVTALVDTVVLVTEKTDADFLEVIEQFTADRSQTVIVGDRFNEEIAIALRIGVSAIWITVDPAERSREGLTVVSSLDEATSVLRLSVR